MPDKVKMNFNGREVECEAGKSIIQLAGQLGEPIPHFCYHPGIGVDGNCRLCLVELEGAPKLVTACTLSASEGMTVVANSEKVIKARKGVLEFLLINHPLDCPICDKGGECPLQDYTRDHGPGHSRFVDDKNLGTKHKVFGEHIMFDSERCVLCTRCVRFQRDVVGREELGVFHRGDRAQVGLFGDRQLTSGLTGNLVDLCPVGALTSRQFRFQARPWELQKVETSCGGCSLHCSARVWWKDGTPLRMTPRADMEVNAWWLCDKGRFGSLSDGHETAAAVRRQGEAVPVSGEEARERAMSLLSDNPQRSAVLAGSRCSNEELAAALALQQRLRGDLSPFPPFGSLTGFGRELGNLADLDSFSGALVLGADPGLTHPILALRLASAKIPVTLVHEGDQAPGSTTRSAWTQVSADPRAWLEGDGRSWFAQEGTRLLVVHGGLLESGGGPLNLPEGSDLRVIVLHEGFNRRGLLEAAKSAPRVSVMEALGRGEIDTLLVLGLDPDLDLVADQDWEETIGRAGRLIVQSRGLDRLTASAEVVLDRRAAVDLAGTVTNCLGQSRTLGTWKPVAGRRRGDADWLAGGDLAESLEVSK